jgi:glutathione synthase/RimK-type ligase-like ATP-grasp enzyme
MRLVVAGGRVVGAACRIARSGEWRTNAALGAQVEPVEPPPLAQALALAAAAAARADLVGVDLLPTSNGGFVVLELNGAVDFRPVYAPLRDVFSETVAALLEDGVRQPELAAASL